MLLPNHICNPLISISKDENMSLMINYSVEWGFDVVRYSRILLLWQSNILSFYDC